ncbi:4-hydroxy-tetrahydrodipicolinate synthase [Natronomonas sp. F2-12]|jgi:4-hydroxy-tetrahydrodipicolinate synthase|uniref:4-hydroxy-tetrahydrodipicolinate synthase n=1 Tax=Natronomonas aquatica TaxID=2841590 RepID=A0A9R1D792_9EURY|nr:4-hydroxy-tetrahydrodipicolinate synthase [Natronomonas aquatica]MCQ4334357.1 4-hydroxy-tetrahydrodipicolinate synthase [Natronomonas aquatica]
MSDPATDIDLPPVASLPTLVTPFDADETVDHDALSALAEWTIDRGVDGLVPCGTTGEFASLTVAERRAVIETTVEAADGRVPVVAGAGATTAGDVREFIEDAAAVGADAALVPSPYYHAANDPAGNRLFYQRVADGSELPIYLYNIPACTGGPIALETVTELAPHDAIHGIKDTSGDFSAVERFIGETPSSFRVFQGYDDHFVGAWVMGSNGGMNALAGVFPKAFRTLCDALEAGDLGRARAIQRHVLSPVFGACLDHGFAPGAKVALQVRGMIDHATVRPPLVELGGKARTDIADAVEDALAYLE